MSQDYFLKKTYNAVYKANKAKSPFRTLSESYRLVLEEKETGIDVDKLKIQETPWTLEQKNFYTDRPNGVGPGELSVASVINNNNPDRQTALYIVQGGSKDFDISFKKYKFEVKETNSKVSVRIGKHGTKVGEEIYKIVDEILDEIIDQYELLNPGDKDTVNKKLLSNKNVKENFKAGWSVETWAKGIKGDRNELPFTAVFTQPGTGLKRGETKSSVLISIKDFLNIVDDISENLKTEKPFENKHNENPHVREIAGVLKRLYGNSQSKEAEKLYKHIDSTAVKVDKDITKKKINITKEGGRDWKEFFIHLSKDNFNNKLDNLKKQIDSPEKIKKLFPDDLTGLFVVSPLGYRYIPKDYIGNYVIIERVSMKAPKIVLKQFSKDTEVQQPPEEQEFS